MLQLGQTRGLSCKSFQIARRSQFDGSAQNCTGASADDMLLFWSQLLPTLPYNTDNSLIEPSFALENWWLYSWWKIILYMDSFIVVQFCTCKTNFTLGENMRREYLKVRFANVKKEDKFTYFITNVNVRITMEQVWILSTWLLSTWIVYFLCGHMVEWE